MIHQPTAGRLPCLVAAACLAAALTACGGTSGSGDTDTAPDTAGDTGADAASDTAADTVVEDVPPTDTAPDDTAPADTGSDDTTPGDVADADDTADDTADADDVADAEDAADSAADTGGDTGPADVDTVQPPATCLLDAQCDDGDACTVDKCVVGPDGLRACIHPDAVCTTPDPCLVPSCDPATGCAVTLASSPACCFDETLSLLDFEGPVDGLVIEDLAPGGNPPVGWVPSLARAHTGTGSLWFGDPASQTFDNGGIVAGRVTLPPVALPTGARAELRFHLWADVEAGDIWDVVIVEVDAGDGPVPVWVKDYESVQLGAWQPITVDLAAFGGASVAISVTFNSTDETYNDTEGVYLDDVWVWVGCGTLDCEADAACSDGIACTDEVCDAGTCAYTASTQCCVIDADCFDSDSCTVDLCQNFACQYTPVADPLCCNTVEDCDDANACTIDTCVSGAQSQCAYAIDFAAGCCETAPQCDDADPCTVDLCTSSLCEHVNTCCFEDAECDDGDDLCTIDTCVGGGCQFSFTGEPGCCDPEPFIDDFEGTVGGWTYAAGIGGCSWQIVQDGETLSGTGSLYYGDPATKDYDCGTNKGTAISGPIELKTGLPFQLTAAAWFDTETSSSFDVVELWAISGSQEWKLWAKPSITKATWIPISVDVSAFGGKIVQLEWRFDSKDGVANTGEGVYVDDITVTSPCLPKACDTSFDCSDGQSFSTDTCLGGVCSWQIQ